MVARLQHSVESVERMQQTGGGALKIQDVGAACGLEGAQQDSLLGETSHGTGQDDEYSKQRKPRQHLGATLFTLYCAIYAALMGLSFLGLIPVFDFELRKLSDAENFAAWLSEHMYMPFLFSFLYVLVIFGIQSIMKDRKPFNLRYPLAAWSLALATFSILGSLRTVPSVLRILYYKGADHLICGDTRFDWVDGDPAGWWTMIFILSKVPELGDTLFIVLRKRTLITLHWYHHITVMTFCWHSWATFCLNGLVYSSMNLTVHAFMYFFYTLTALGYRPTKYAQMITVIQILQMLVGTAVTTYVNIHEYFVQPKQFEWAIGPVPWHADPGFATSPLCAVHPTNAIAGLIMYTSYLWLFCVFFYQAYLVPKAAKNKAKAAAAIAAGVEHKKEK